MSMKWVLKYTVDDGYNCGCCGDSIDEEEEYDTLKDALERVAHMRAYTDFINNNTKNHKPALYWRTGNFFIFQRSNEMDEKKILEGDYVSKEYQNEYDRLIAEHEAKVKADKEKWAKETEGRERKQLKRLVKKYPDEIKDNQDSTQGRRSKSE